MKFNIIKSIFSIALMLCAATCFQSCKDDEEDMFFTDLASEITVKYGTDLKVAEIPEIDENAIIIPGELYKMGVLIEGSSVGYYNGVIYTTGIGKSIVKFFKGDRENIIKSYEITVEPNFYLTMTVGESKPVEEVIGEKPTDVPSLGGGSILEISSDGIMFAAEPGNIDIVVNNKYIVVTINPYSGPELFEHPYMDKYASADQIKKGMKDYNLSSEKTEKINNIEYIVLTYAPFGKCKSISYYIKKSGWSYFQYALVDTGTDTNTYGWLMRDYDPYISRHEILYFTQKNAGYTAWRIYPENGSWTVLNLQFP